MELKQKVLIVDDEPRNQRIVVEILEDVVEMKLCSNGTEALAVVEEFKPDLILLDIMMPGLNGYEVCKKIRTLPSLSLTKIILVSGKGRVEERLEGYAAGADSYMVKPFVPEELLAISKVFLRLTAVEKQFATLNQRLEHEVNNRAAQLVEAEFKLAASAKMSALGEMAGGIAHEINTPLATMGLLAHRMRSYISEGKFDVPALLKLTDRMSETVTRVSKIIIGLRTFSRDGSSDPFVMVPVQEVLDVTMSLCIEKLKHADIELRADGIRPDLMIRCRQVQLAQVFLNLIGNSVDAISGLSEKWVQVTAEHSGEGVRLAFTDSGSGIPDHVIEKLFQPFYTTKELGKGTGLGLSISRGIIAAHEGTLEVDRSCKNTRFVLFLPDKGSEDSGSTNTKVA